MESEAEALRLAAQTEAGDVARRLRAVGIRAGQTVLDAGCGAGAVAKEIGKLIGPRGTLIGIDGSAERLKAAELALRELGDQAPALRFLQGDVRKLDVAAESVDVAWTQYVLQYLPDPLPAVRELVRVTRPGGTVAAADIDGFGLAYWPSDPLIEAGYPIFDAALKQHGFDLFVGRKLFTHFKALALTQVSVALDPFYVSAGTASDQLLADWAIRFSALEPAVAPAFGGVERYHALRDAYLAMLRAPDALKYAVVLTTVGQRP